MPNNFAGSLSSRLFDMAARIIGAVYSGLSVKDELFLSLKVYISLSTTSLCSPNGLLNKSDDSKIGVIISLNPKEFAETFIFF